MWILQWVMSLIQTWLMWYVYAMEFYLSMKENEICRKISGNGNYITQDNPESERQILHVLSHVLIQMSTFYRCVLMWKWVCVESRKQGRDQCKRKRLYRRGVGRVIEHTGWEGGSGVIRVIRGGARWWISKNCGCMKMPENFYFVTNKMKVRKIRKVIKMLLHINCSFCHFPSIFPFIQGLFQVHRASL